MTFLNMGHTGAGCQQQAPASMPGFTQTAVGTHVGVHRDDSYLDPFPPREQGPAGPRARLPGPHVRDQGGVWELFPTPPGDMQENPCQSPSLCRAPGQVCVRRMGQGPEEQQLARSELRALPCLREKQNIILFLISGSG